MELALVGVAPCSSARSGSIFGRTRITSGWYALASKDRAVETAVRGACGGERAGSLSRGAVPVASLARASLVGSNSNLAQRWKDACGTSWFSKHCKHRSAPHWRQWNLQDVSHPLEICVIVSPIGIGSLGLDKSRT